VSRVLLEAAQYKSRSGADQWLSGVSQIREIGTRALHAERTTPEPHAVQRTPSRRTGAARAAPPPANVA